VQFGQQEWHLRPIKRKPHQQKQNKDKKQSVRVVYSEKR
jgi:hypothetical protein